jgi:hypothetical protein
VAGGTYFIVIEGMAMSISTAVYALLVCPVRIAVMSKNGGNEE